MKMKIVRIKVYFNKIFFTIFILLKDKINEDFTIQEKKIKINSIKNLKMKNKINFNRKFKKYE